MTINAYAKNWCDEKYDVRQEDFFLKNAYYVIDREWAMGGLKHGIFNLVIAIAVFAITYLINPAYALLSSLIDLGVLASCFWFYGIRTYDANSEGSGRGMYIFLAIFLFIAKYKVPTVVAIVFAILSTALFAYLSVYRPIRFIKTARDMKKRIIEQEKEEDAAAKDTYDAWKKEFEAFRYGLPQHEAPEGDPLLVEAEKLFKGYTSDSQMLKTRFRQLAKTHHPDVGGDTELFQCILQVYEKLAKAISK